MFGAVREPAGASLPGIAPSNAYPCRDGYVLIAGNGDAIYTRLMARIGRDDLGRDPDLAHNDGRARRVAEIDQAIGAWTGERAIDEVLQAMREADVPSGRIYSVADIAHDPHYQARGAITRLEAASGIAVDMPAVFPCLSANPGAVRELSLIHIWSRRAASVATDARPAGAWRLAPDRAGRRAAGGRAAPSAGGRAARSG